jgi:uncharacterized membrane protein
MSELPTPSEPSASATGLEPNAAGALSYLFMPLTGILFLLLEKERSTVRFHAAQSTVIGGALMVAWIAFSILSKILVMIPILGWVIALVIWMVLGLGGFVLWLVLMVRAYKGEEWHVPLAADYAQKLLATPAVQ